jgi:hypothetical protein
MNLGSHRHMVEDMGVTTPLKNNFIQFFNVYMQ